MKIIRIDLPQQMILQRRESCDLDLLLRSL